MFVATSSSSVTNLTQVSSNVVQSQPEQAEFAVPVPAPPRSTLRSRDVFLPVPSPYRPADYVSETPESVSSLSEGDLSEEDRLLSDELAEIDENRSAYKLSELHEPRKRVSFRVKVLDSRYLEEVVGHTKPENWLDELLEERVVPMDLPVESPLVGNRFMEPHCTLEYPGVRLWDRPLSSAPASLSRASSPPDLSPYHLPLERLEADAAAVTVSIEESTGHVASRSSLGTSIDSTSSSASSTSPTKSVAYCGIDFETVSVVPGSLSFDKSRTLYTIPLESNVEPDDDVSVVRISVSCSGDVVKSS